MEAALSAAARFLPLATLLGRPLDVLYSRWASRGVNRGCCCLRNAPLLDARAVLQLTFFTNQNNKMQAWWAQWQLLWEGVGRSQLCEPQGRPGHHCHVAATSATGPRVAVARAWQLERDFLSPFWGHVHV